MTLFLFYILAFLSLSIGSAAIYMALIKGFPVNWLYHHYFLRKPICWAILALLLVWTAFLSFRGGQIPLFAIPPILLSVLGLILAYKMHQSHVFQAVDFPNMASEVGKSPLSPGMEIAVIHHNGVTKSYPLDYVIHHHIINDEFNSKLVSLTYCAMCRSVIAFDVTDVGPLFVGSFKHGNMIVADRKTKTFFQQETFKSIIGNLHPHELKMIPLQILAYEDLQKQVENPQIVEISEEGLREFELPIPGIWKRIMAKDLTPGIPGRDLDERFPPGTRVVGIMEEMPGGSIFYLKRDVVEKKIVENAEQGLFLIASSGTVNGFHSQIGVGDSDLEISFSDGLIVDRKSNTQWNLLGKYLQGPIDEDLRQLALSEEYWFGWSRFHPDSKRVKV